jgi:exodeoxyribonuclease-5
MSQITLSKDQEKAYKLIAKWLGGGGCVTSKQKNPKLLTLAGLGGCGKTFLVSLLAKEFDKSIRFAFCALSGRAASVLGNKLKANGIIISNKESHYCGTIHRLIYKPIENDKGEIIYWAKKEVLDYDVIVLDEASMISEDIFKDLSSYNVDILAVGDHGQLPPIEGKFCLMKEPHIKLEKIHRQAEGNPIISLAMTVRETGKIPTNYKNNNHVQIIKKSEYIPLIESIYLKEKDPIKLLDTAILCYKNTTRCNLNTTIRKMIFGSYLKQPVANDLVVCLRNSKGHVKDPIYNGFRGYIHSSITELDDDFIEARVNFPDEGINKTISNICKHQFGFQKTFSSFDELKKFGMDVSHWNETGMLFDYGYASTCHKFQGNQLDNIIVYNERPAPVDDDTYKRWLYTAVSRSSNKLTIVV